MRAGMMDCAPKEGPPVRVLLFGSLLAAAGCAVPVPIAEDGLEASSGSNGGGTENVSGTGGAAVAGTGGAAVAGTGGTGGSEVAGTGGSEVAGTGGSEVAGAGGSGGASGSSGSGGVSGSSGSGGSGGCSLQREPIESVVCGDCMRGQCCEAAQDCDTGTPCGLLTDCALNTCPGGITLDDCFLLYCSVQATNVAVDAWNARANCLNGVCASDCGNGGSGGSGGGGSCQTTISYGVPACDNCMQSFCCPELQACQTNPGCACLLTGGSFCSIDAESFSLYTTADRCEFDMCFNECF